MANANAFLFGKLGMLFAFAISNCVFLLYCRFLVDREQQNIEVMLQEFFGAENIQTTADGAMHVRVALSHSTSASDLPNPFNKHDSSEELWKNYLKVAREVYNKRPDAVPVKDAKENEVKDRKDNNPDDLAS